ASSSRSCRSGGRARGTSWATGRGQARPRTQVRLRAARARIGAHSHNLLGGITDAEERTEPDPHARDLPAAAAQTEQPAVAAADQPVVLNNVEEGDRRSR